VKNVRKPRLPEKYRENHLSQMKKKIDQDFRLQQEQRDTGLTLLRMLAKNNPNKLKGEK